MNTLIRKYNVPVPRYTSYPTVPYWQPDTFSIQGWLDSATKTFAESNAPQGISLYIHLPFCEKLCTFCGCNKRITKNHAVEEVYITALLKEWQMYLDLLPGRPVIKDLHLGGGSPTFFRPDRLAALIEKILAPTDIHPDAAFSFEANPNTTHKDHLFRLADLGFKRLSFGIQDFDPTVQDIINRIQPFEQVREVHEWAREAGYESINYDLIFGLPFQKEASIHDTFEKTGLLKPDRIAYYSYAHVPWIKGTGQRRFSKIDLPKDEEKRRLYEIGRQHLTDQGYIEIGMDHFALPTDSLYRAVEEGTLHRNFMGYVEDRTDLMIGLGVSSISDSWTGFAQNEKKLEDYYARLEKEAFAVFRGHLLNQEDLAIRQHILDLMCRFQTQLPHQSQVIYPFEKIRDRLLPLVGDELISLKDDQLTVLPAGRPFIRNICMAFDARLWRDKPEAQLFSMSI